MMWHITENNEDCAVKIADIPVSPYAAFYGEMCARLQDENFHIAAYFGVRTGTGLKFFCIALDDGLSSVMITSWEYGYYSDDSLLSLTALYPAVHPFERDITERFGLHFKGSPYDKPLRFAHDRADKTRTVNNYPFYTIAGHSLHQVNVGPVHAGIIEPGAFRFVCNGEKVLHMEVVLGYQHRGIENLILSDANRLRQVLLSENIAGDSAVSNAVSMCRVFEALAGFNCAGLDAERAIALELERIAMHIADMGALCADVGYQLGQVACEALRTITINTTQQWCGNRFGKSLVRPLGTNFALTPDKAAMILTNMRDVKRRFAEVCEDIFSTTSVLSRFEDCGAVGRSQVIALGAVGLPARASGLGRDIRATHAYGAYANTIGHRSIVLENGDVMSRAEVRSREVAQSIGYIEELLAGFCPADVPAPVYDFVLPADTLSFSVVEGWRGEICHTAVTDGSGSLIAYNVKDPSLHNWYALSLAVRGGGISDFPVCNKSFNLSYAGHDL